VASHCRNDHHRLAGRRRRRDVNGVLVTGANGQQIAGAYGTLTIISFR
jgi:hypothetical protein